MSDVNLTISADDVYKLVREIKNLMAVNVELHKDIDANHKAQDTLRAEYAAYKAKESERETSIREAVFEEYHRRTKLLELNERRNQAYSEYLGSEGIALNAIKATLRGRITKKTEAEIKSFLDSINAAWAKFDAVQKQIADELRVATWDPCKTKMPPTAKDAICADCAAKLGKVPVDYPVGQWTGKCDFCGQEKPLSSLIHDYV